MTPQERTRKEWLCTGLTFNEIDAMPDGTQGSVNFGRLLAQARKAKSYSQLDLAAAAEISQKHLSFLETGRSRPSRVMLDVLAETLSLSEGEKYQLFSAAGFALHPPSHAEAHSQTLAGIALILRSAEPFPAVVFDRLWHIVMMNRPYGAFIEQLTGGRIVLGQAYTLLPEPRVNLVEATIGSDYYMSRVLSWRETIASELLRVRWDVLNDPDPRRHVWWSHVVKGVNSFRPLSDLDLGEAVSSYKPLVPVTMQMGPETAHLFNSVMRLHTNGEAGLSGLRVKIYYPLDDRAEQVVREHTFPQTKVSASGGRAPEKPVTVSKALAT
ncbi:helix-turn-helix domain-containing protein [Rhodomicrobium sp.]|uniref:helix-turn-helix domain-containing protein n=1 Tax=Rhodomicrobium sp. TaxID=2720632 RepID=UPI0039E316F5